MRHLKALIARKTMLSVLAVGVISAGALGGTYANFTATPVTIASNAFATGTLSIGRSGSGAIFNVSAQKIGQEATGSLTITNTGTIDGVFTGTAASTGTLAPSIKLVIYRDNDNVAGSKLYDGTLAAFSSADLGTIVPAASTTFYFHVSLPTTGTDAGDNLLQGSSASTTFTWTAVQA